MAAACAGCLHSDVPCWCVLWQTRYCLAVVSWLLPGYIVMTRPKQCAEYQAGKENLLGFFVGQVMKASKGKANPKKVNTLLRQRLMSEKVQS